jgi:hypothetical protein
LALDGGGLMTKYGLIDGQGKNVITNLAPSTVNGQPVVHQQLGSGFNPNLILSNWTAGPAVSNSTAEVPIGQFDIGGAGFQAFSQWELDSGWYVENSTGGNIFGNFRVSVGGTQILTNENNTSPIGSSAFPKSCLCRVSLMAISSTQVACNVILRVGTGTNADNIDQGNFCDHTGSGVVTVPDLNTSRVLQVTFQPETASSQVVIIPLFSHLEEKRPNGSISGGGVTDGDKGDIIVSNSGATWTIENNSVSLAKIADIATGVVVGRISPATGDPETLTPVQLASLINVYPSYPIRSGTVITIAVNEIAPGTQSITPNTLRASPWELKRPITISQIRQEISTAGVAGSTLRLGLYADDVIGGYPGQLVANSDTGVLDTATTGVRLYDPTDFLLQPGLYWLVINCNNTCTIRAIPSAGIAPVLGVNPAGGTNSHYTCWSVASAYGPMPATFPAGAARTANTNAPWTMFTIA